MAARLSCFQPLLQCLGLARPAETPDRSPMPVPAPRTALARPLAGRVTDEANPRADGNPALTPSRWPVYDLYKNLPEEVKTILNIHDELFGAGHEERETMIREALARTDLSSITELSFRNKGLTHIPTGVFEHFPNLKKLDLFGNFLRSLKGLPREMKKLEHLNLSKNQLETLEGFPETLKNLKELYLYDNRLTDLKHLPAALQSLEMCDLSKNRLKPRNSIADFPFTMRCFKRIYISDNAEIYSFDDWKGALRTISTELEWH